jgi:ribonuclease E
MAGLIVIDFIDMEQSGHVRKVERAMKEALKNDRARIQVGRISSFGLMEMSRQRLRTGVLEASTRPCPHCEGTGLIRTAASAGLAALRMIEDEATRGRGEKILLRAGRDAAVYVLNKKRAELADIEQRYGVSIDIAIDESFEGAKMTVESTGPKPTAVPRPLPAPIVDDEEEEDEELEAALVGAEDYEEELEARAEEDERPGRRRRRRRRGGRGRSRRDGGPAEVAEAAEEAAEPVTEAAAEPAEDEAPAPRKRRRRGRKSAEAPEVVEPDSSPMVERPVAEEPPIAETEAAEEPKPKAHRRKKAAEPAPAESAPAEAAPVETAEDKPPAKRTRKRPSKAAKPAEAEPAEPSPQPALAANNDEGSLEDAGEPRRGWWQKTFG